ncbi:nitroreductase family protein [Solwaraspora sp. WMMD1047]|uniref:nitroreductase family protein n=1 Tax=Solwaraspora sp. WMMD1047 TaxID=3016102 RepID=UPI002417688E|nr:nitroreductase family protein [Solwaraspora sp. WMMD1047]MDG4833922.1 nitroreductase family protein [Solwaraspora sp. WMMD1047]
MAQLSPLLASRWSPRAFDPAAVVTEAELDSLLEAARWAPSAGNAQPWRFLVGRRDDEAYKRIFTNLPGEVQRWAGRASLLLVGAHLTTDPPGSDPGQAADDPGQPAYDLDQAAYDLGQAIAHLTVQATALRLHVRQVSDLDVAGLRADLDLPAEVRPRVVVAIGRLGDPLSLPTDLRRQELALRQRRPLGELLLDERPPPAR